MKIKSVTVSLLIFFLLPVFIVLANRVIDARFKAVTSQTEITSPDFTTLKCEPALTQTDFEIIDRLVISQSLVTDISFQMAEIFAADQTDRSSPIVLGKFSSPSERDLQRRLEVLGYIRGVNSWAPVDLTYAAFIFQHGNCSDHYFFANLLAKRAMEAGHDEARWIYAATLDRYLLSLGKLQKYGTQYYIENGQSVLLPVDPSTTDAERQQYNVPPPAVTSQTEQTSPRFLAIMQLLESWWFGLVGMGFAALSALVAWANFRVHDRLIKFLLGVAMFFALVSVSGHYFEVKALNLSMSKFLDQQILFRWLLFGAVLVLLFFTFFVVITLVRYKSIESGNQSKISSSTKSVITHPQDKPADKKSNSNV